ncbi:hypothetical protein TRVL_01297 [Trypanosoma vivax]|nr:hypothetical protein TRVL_01297 [Trypanosoma vivax]
MPPLNSSRASASQKIHIPACWQIPQPRRPHTHTFKPCTPPCPHMGARAPSRCVRAIRCHAPAQERHSAHPLCAVPCQGARPPFTCAPFLSFHLPLPPLQVSDLSVDHGEQLTFPSVRIVNKRLSHAPHSLASRRSPHPHVPSRTADHKHAVSPLPLSRHTSSTCACVHTLFYTRVACSDRRSFQTPASLGGFRTLR